MKNRSVGQPLQNNRNVGSLYCYRQGLDDTDVKHVLHQSSLLHCIRNIGNLLTGSTGQALALSLDLGQEKKDIEGLKYLDAPEGMDLQVLVRDGCEFKIHPDQNRQWTNTGGEVAKEYLSE